MSHLPAPWFLSVANAVKRAIDYKPLTVFRQKLSVIQTTIITVPNAWASANPLTPVIRLLLTTALHRPHFRIRSQGLCKVTFAEETGPGAGAEVLRLPGGGRANGRAPFSLQPPGHPPPDENSKGLGVI